jgi:LPPG:FO 2-phospho-L-lactate transferase
MKIVALAGGVGGAKMVDGLAQCLAPDDLFVIVNTGDDFEHFGLSISPDLDTVCYTLAGLNNEITGWGRKDESWRLIEEIKKLGGETWFNLGDLDFATHLERTRRLKNGEKLSNITKSFCRQWGVRPTVAPMSDIPIRTKVNTKEKGWLSFQEYFVKYQFQPVMTGYRFDNIENADFPDEARKALLEADWVVLCPSNPFVSIEPILKVEDIEQILTTKKVLAVSPIVGGKAIKGPAAKMFLELGITPSAYEVLRKFKNIIDVFLVDFGDAEEIDSQEHWNIIIKEMNTIMSDRHERKRFALEVLDYLEELNKGHE